MVVQNVKKSKLEHEDSTPERQMVDGDPLMEKLHNVQDELEKLDEEEGEEVLEVEQKYSEIRQPIYDKRNEVIQTIPDFWLTAFLSHPMLSDLMSEEDHKIFKYLQSLGVLELKDVKLGYSIAFNFHPNPYFENAKLTKTFSVDDEGKTNIIGTDIKWKDAKGTSNGTSHVKEGNKRPIAEQSFFTWFNEISDGDLLELMHDEVADIIREDLWPNPLKYFNNEGDESDDDDEDENVKNNGNAEDDSEDDDEEDDS